MTDCLLGLPLEEAARRLREQGTEPVVRYTCAPQGRPDGTLRVIRARGEELTVARFEDDAARAQEE